MTILLWMALLVQAGDPFPPPDPRDAGTWLRKSFSVVPVAVAPCRRTPESELRAEWKRNHPKAKKPARGELEALARRNDEVCAEVRGELLAQGTSYSAVPRLHRFDDNELDPAAEDRLRTALEHDGFGAKFAKALHDEFGERLSFLLDQSALDRARSLESDLQKNSMVAEKTKTEDITATQTAMVHGAAYLLTLRLDGLRVSRIKSGWIARAHRRFEIWHFDPSRRTFAAKASWEESIESKPLPQPVDLALDLWAGSAFDDRLLGLEEFRFTAQLEDVVEKGLRPAATLRANTDADLRVHRRFVYLENRLIPGHGTKSGPVGWGYIDRADPADSLYDLRHIGGQDPYAGLVVEEVPGTSWQILSFSVVPGSADDRAAGSSGPSVRFQPSDDRGWEVRFGTRGNLPGDLPNQNLLLDLMLGFESVSAQLDIPGSKVGATQTGTWMANVGMETGWTLRYPIRRLALTAGPVAGAGWQFLPLHAARYMATGSAPPKDPPVGFARLDRSQAWLGLRAGAQWSLTVSGGIGIEVGWEALRYQGDWSTGGAGSSQDVAGGTKAGPGTLRFSLQWISG